MMPATFSHRLSRPSRHGRHTPQVWAPYMTTFWPGVNPVTPSPSWAISPEASAPTTSGSLRLAKAIPRKPHTSMWLRPTARTRICTSPGPGGGGGSRASMRRSRSPKSWSPRIRSPEPLPSRDISRGHLERGRVGDRLRVLLARLGEAVPVDMLDHLAEKAQAHGGERPAPQAAGVVLRIDEAPILGRDEAAVEVVAEVVDAAAGDRIAALDRPFDGGDAAMARQEGGVVADRRLARLGHCVRCDEG